MWREGTEYADTQVIVVQRFGAILPNGANSAFWSAMKTASLASLLLVSMAGCSQAAMVRSASDILSSVVLGGSATGGSSSRGPAAAPPAAQVLGEAEEYLGVPYRWGGSTPSEGFDCSGYVRYVYGRQGVRLPRTSREQARAGQGVSARLGSLRAGDLLLFAESDRPISHVAIYAGGGRIIHSSSSGRGVRYDELDTRRGQWFVEHMVAARRLAVDGRSLVQSLELLAQPGVAFDAPDHAPRPR